MVFWVCVLALLLDHWLGEPRRWHPLVGFGALAKKPKRIFWALTIYRLGRVVCVDWRLCWFCSCLLMV